MQNYAEHTNVHLKCILNTGETVIRSHNMAKAVINFMLNNREHYCTNVRAIIFRSVQCGVRNCFCHAIN